MPSPYNSHSNDQDNEPENTWLNTGLQVASFFLTGLLFRPLRSLLIMASVLLISILFIVMPAVFLAPVLVTVLMGIVGGLSALVTTTLLGFYLYKFGFPDISSPMELSVCDEDVIAHDGEIAGHAILTFESDDLANEDSKIPHLVIEAETKEKCDYVQGHKMGVLNDKNLSEYQRIYSNMKSFMTMGDIEIPEWGSEQMNEMLSKFIPLTQEMENMAAGHNSWAQQNGRPTIDARYLLLLNLLPEPSSIRTLDMAAGVLYLHNGSQVSYQDVNSIEKLQQFLANNPKCHVEYRIGQEAAFDYKIDAMSLLNAKDRASAKPAAERPVVKQPDVHGVPPAPGAASSSHLMFQSVANQLKKRGLPQDAEAQNARGPVNQR